MNSPEPPAPADRPVSELWSGKPLPDDELLRRWQAALVAAGADEVPSASPAGHERLDAGRQLLARWREPHRRYHDLEHLSEVLIALDLLAAPPGVSRLTAFFHDAVYQGVSGKDEADSAALAELVLGPALPAEAVGAVARAVLATRDHTAHGAVEQVFNDADLAILAAPEARYTRYLAGVRAEYAAYSDVEFAAGRRSVLEGLLSRPRLFATDAAHRLWEPRARANLAAELELSGHGFA